MQSLLVSVGMSKLTITVLMFVEPDRVKASGVILLPMLQQLLRILRIPRQLLNIFFIF